MVKEKINKYIAELKAQLLKLLFLKVLKAKGKKGSSEYWYYLVKENIKICFIRSYPYRWAFAEHITIFIEQMQQIC